MKKPDYSQRYYRRFLTPMERFEDAWEEDENGCWLWMRHIEWDGYGRTNLNRRPVRAPRMAWELYRGHIPKGLLVLHNCDVPRCVNPDHLRLGTARDNIKDALDRGRYVNHPGEKNGMAKLTASDVLDIRASKDSERVLGERYGIDPSRAGEIRRGKGWKHVK